MQSLPIVRQSTLNVPAINWEGLPTRFFNPGELEVLIALVLSIEPPAQYMVEFGVNEGRTAKAILREVKSIEYYVGVDVTPDYVPSCPVQRREIPKYPGNLVKDDPLFSLIVSPRGSLDLTLDNFGKAAVDCVFIDGDHSRKVVEYDTELATQAVRPGGLIVWHDYHTLGTVDVKPYLDELRIAHRRNIVHIEDTWLAYERR